MHRFTPAGHQYKNIRKKVHSFVVKETHLLNFECVSEKLEMAEFTSPGTETLLEAIIVT